MLSKVIASGGTVVASVTYNCTGIICKTGNENTKKQKLVKVRGSEEVVTEKKSKANTKASPEPSASASASATVYCFTGFRDACFTGSPLRGRGRKSGFTSSASSGSHQHTQPRPSLKRALAMPPLPPFRNNCEGTNFLTEWSEESLA